MSGGKGGAATDELAYDLAMQFESKLPSTIDVDGGDKNMFKPDSKGRVPSLSVFLRQEVDRFNKMLKVMSASLEQLKRGIKGQIVMSEELEKMYQSFLINQV